MEVFKWPKGPVVFYFSHLGRFSTLKLLVSINLLLLVNCYYSIKLFPIKFSQKGIKSGCALFLFIPSVVFRGATI